MTFEFAKKTGRALALTSAVVAAVSLSAMPSSAYARDWHDGGNWHGGGGWHGNHWDGAAIGLGILGGALVGATVASNSYYYPYSYSYPYSYGYGYPYYGYGYGNPYYSYGPAPYSGDGY